MSKQLINEYLSQLDLIKKISGSNRETIVREAFKDLLKSWGRQAKLVFLAEYPVKTNLKSNIIVDGALLHELRMPLGYWEAKDESDNLDEEILKKIKKGYPQDNIIFTDDVTAVLWQKRVEVMRCDMTDTKALATILKLYFSFERAEIADFRAAVEQFKIDLPAVLQALRSMIETENENKPSFRIAQANFLDHAKEVINPILTEADVREMLIQHILTEEIFAKVFDDSDFHQHNNVARGLYALEAEFFTGNLKKNTLKNLEPYYSAIRSTAAQIGSHSEKQTFLKVIYENFYKVYNKKAADRLGVIYTPNEIVKFMISGVDWLTEKYFDKSLIDSGVDILDPATGTGTFICELLEHFRGQPDKLRNKYLNELYANEVAILPYYVANLNIESTYAALAGKYEEFPNLCFVDTLDNVGLHTAAVGTTAQLFGSVSEENVLRIRRQNGRRISVVIGNPPYNANQANENDNNKNRLYPAIDARIKTTYIAESTAQKTKLYDMYARFFRWSSDRLGKDGILAFITNRSFIESRTYDGFRKTVAKEFSEIYVVDLGGDVRANPKLSGTKHNVFGIQTGVAISFMIKRTTSGNSNSKTKSDARIYYIRRPELETAEEKLRFLTNNSINSLSFEEIQKDKAHNWTNIQTNDYEDLLPLASKATKATTTNGQERAIFKFFTNGVNTARDQWVYDRDQKNLERKISFLIEKYNDEYAATQKRGSVDSELSDKSIKWSEGLYKNVKRIPASNFLHSRIVNSAYRPFCNLSYYADPIFSDRLTSGHSQCFGPDYQKVSKCFAVSAPSAGGFNVLAVNGLADWHFLGDTQLFPLQRTSEESEVANITNWALNKFSEHYKSIFVTDDQNDNSKNKKKKITKESIFYYCYAVLHDPIYREKYSINLSRDFPRIPFYVDFWRWVAWGESLYNLHLNFNTAELFCVVRNDSLDAKAKAAGISPDVILRSIPNEGRIVLDSETILSNIPQEAWNYRISGRSAIDWVLDQLKEKKIADPTVASLFNPYRFHSYKESAIVLLSRVISVSLDTEKVVVEMKFLGR